MSSTGNRYKRPNSNPAKRPDPRSPAGKLFQLVEGLDRQLQPFATAWQERIAALQDWFHRPQPDRPAASAQEKPATSPPKRRKRGVKAIEEDYGRLIMMAQAIDAGDAKRNEPTSAVRLLPEYADVLQHNRTQFEERLVGKYNGREFQEELSQRRKTSEWQEAVEQRKKSRSPR
jgi:hypothetical protein